MGCLQDQTSTSHSFFVSTKTTANSRGKKRLRTFAIDLETGQRWCPQLARSQSAALRPVQTELQSHWTPLIIKKSPVLQNSAAPNDEHVTFVIKKHHFWSFVMVSAKGWKPLVRLTARLWPVGYFQTRHMHVAPETEAKTAEIKNKSAFGGVKHCSCVLI